MCQPLAVHPVPTVCATFARRLDCVLAFRRPPLIYLSGDVDTSSLWLGQILAATFACSLKLIGRWCSALLLVGVVCFLGVLERIALQPVELVHPFWRVALYVASPPCSFVEDAQFGVVPDGRLAVRDAPGGIAREVETRGG